MKFLRLLSLLLALSLLAACQGGNILTSSTPTTAVLRTTTASPSPTFTVTPTPLPFTTAIPPAPLVVSEVGKAIIEDYPAGTEIVETLDSTQRAVIDATVGDVSRYDAALQLLTGTNPRPEDRQAVLALLDQLHGAARARMAGAYESMQVYTNGESWGVLVTDTNGNWYEFEYVHDPDIGVFTRQGVLGLNPFSNQQIDWDSLFATTGRQLSSFVTLVKITDGMTQVGSANGWLVRTNGTEWLDARTGTAEVAVPPEFVKDEANNLFVRLDASEAEIQVAEVMIEDGSRFVIDSQTHLGVSPEGFIYHDVGEGKVDVISLGTLAGSLPEGATVGVVGNVITMFDGQGNVFRSWNGTDWVIHVITQPPATEAGIANIVRADSPEQTQADLQAIADVLYAQWAEYGPWQMNKAIPNGTYVDNWASGSKEILISGAVYINKGIVISQYGDGGFVTSLLIPGGEQFDVPFVVHIQGVRAYDGSKKKFTIADLASLIPEYGYGASIHIAVTNPGSYTNRPSDITVDPDWADTILSIFVPEAALTYPQGVTNDPAVIREYLNTKLLPGDVDQELD